MDKNAIIGCILGTTVGDAIGLPYEGLSLRKQQKLTKNILKHRLIFNHGMVSDDTEHTVIVAQSLIVSAGDERIFANTLKWQLMFWLLTLPAGIGFATLRGILKLWLGFPPHKSGVFSAGNGPAMRSGLIGVCYGNNPEKMRNLVRISTRITHTDIKAEYGAVAVAIACHISCKNIIITPDLYYQKLREILPEATEFLNLIKAACDSAELGENSAEFATKITSNCHSEQREESPRFFADAQNDKSNLTNAQNDKVNLANANCHSEQREESPRFFADAQNDKVKCQNDKFKGISGYIYHTVPVVIQIWLKYPDNYEKSLTEIIKLGGDTDTTAAILGAIIGSRVGKQGIPANWLNNIWLYPVNLTWLEHLGERLSEVITNNKPQKYVTFPIYGIWFRNILFLIIVIGHLCYRLIL